MTNNSIAINPEDDPEPEYVHNDPGIAFLADFAGAVGGTLGLGHPIGRLAIALGYGYGTVLGTGLNISEYGVSTRSVTVTVGSTAVGVTAGIAFSVLAKAIAGGTIVAAGTISAPAIAVAVGGTVVGVVSTQLAEALINHIITEFENFDPADTPAVSDLGPQPCFPASTPIRLGNGSTVDIESVRLNDTVACTIHAPEVQQQGEVTEASHCPVTASLRTGNVTRLYNNLTEEWITLAIPQPDGSTRLLTATPGHVMLSPDGSWRRLCEMIDGSVVPMDAQSLTDAAHGELAWRKATGFTATDKEGSRSVSDHVSLIADEQAHQHYRPVGTVDLVLEDGSTATAEAHLIRYSAETAHLFEQAEMLVTRTEGGLACQPHCRKEYGELANLRMAA